MKSLDAYYECFKCGKFHFGYKDVPDGFDPYRQKIIALCFKCKDEMNLLHYRDSADNRVVFDRQS